MTQVKTNTEELQKILQEVGTVIYQQAAAEQAKQKTQNNQTDKTGQASAQPGSNQKVVDSDDYEVK